MTICTIFLLYESKKRKTMCRNSSTNSYSNIALLLLVTLIMFSVDSFGIAGEAYKHYLDSTKDYMNYINITLFHDDFKNYTLGDFPDQGG